MLGLLRRLGLQLGRRHVADPHFGEDERQTIADPVTSAFFSEDVSPRNLSCSA